MEILLFLLLLNIKHLLFDFYFQTKDMVIGKSILGDWDGISHSLLHGLGTYICGAIMVVLFSGIPLSFVLGIACIDVVVHYFIDYTKMQMERDVRKDAFWRALGCDQFLHQATYIAFAIILFVR